MLARKIMEKFQNIFGKSRKIFLKNIKPLETWLEWKKNNNTQKDFVCQKKKSMS